MHKKNIIFYLIFSLWAIATYAQTAAQLPEELTRNAYSVVIDNQIEFTCESATSAVKKESITICVLNEKGADAAFFQVMCDNFSSLRKFSGEILDRTGRSIRKIKKSDLQMTEFSSGLSSDDYHYYYDGKGPSYPFTIKYEWEIKYKDGLLSFPIFIPQTTFNQSVVNAVYRFYPSPDVPYRHKSICTDIAPEKKSNGKQNYEEVKFSALKAMEQEPYGPSLVQLAPRIRFDPIRFFFDGKEGSMESWETYGSWQSSLLKDRDRLPDSFRQTLNELTAHCTSDREKVKVLYDYLGKTTRYVSIQLGIGGFQPATAEKVHKSGFGDCKGLSNYMMAMLKAVGIKSHYAEISTKQARFLKDYMSANQTNHVILQVPLEKDTLWLECTNPKLPFGYIPQGLAGHDALVIANDKGVVCQLPSYPDSINTQTTKAVVIINDDGKATVSVSQDSHLAQYEDMSYFAQLPPNKQKEYLLSQFSIGKSSVKEIQSKEFKEEMPHIDISYTVECEQYGNKTGSRLFIPANPFRHRAAPRQKTRIHDIYINYGFTDIDHITIKIPDGYTVETLPKPTLINNQFGYFFSFAAINDDNEIKITHGLRIDTKKHPKEAYQDFVAFNKTIADNYADKLILRKE